jgi:hypothetical protein
VKDLKDKKKMKYRSFSFGERDGDRGRISLILYKSAPNNGVNHNANADEECSSDDSIKKETT